jgi:Ser/Thr protein kinase RdoA (MazF antagonist)
MVTLVPTVDDDLVHRTAKGDWWRATLFIEGARTYEMAPSLEAVFHIAGAFGRFQEMLSDFPGSQLYETIPDFHHTPMRYTALMEAVGRDVRNRAASVRDEIDFVEQRADQLSILLDLLAEGRLPQRVTHNDTKTNNVMIDDHTGEAICVIDLDTVMPGLSLYDFGDMVRAGASLAAEDEQDLSRVALDLDRFEQLVAGYLAAVQEFITPLEVDCLAFSAKLMTLECGIRFLTDYLNGDVYFRTDRPGQNLDRCRTQFKLVGEMEAHFRHLVHLVEKHRPA